MVTDRAGSCRDKEEDQAGVSIPEKEAMTHSEGLSQEGPRKMGQQKKEQWRQHLSCYCTAFLVKWQLGRNGKMQNNELLKATLTLRLLSWVCNKFNLSTVYFRKMWVIKLKAFY